MADKNAAILGNLSNTCNRFLSSGYKDQPSTEEMFSLTASFSDIKGIELVGSWSIDTQNILFVKEQLLKLNIACASISFNYYQSFWAKSRGSGSLPHAKSK